MATVENLLGPCVLCLDEAVTHVNNRCGHMCLCEGCADALQGGDCPICRDPIESSIRVFFPAVKVIEKAKIPQIPQVQQEVVPGLLAITDEEDPHMVQAKLQWDIIQKTQECMETNFIVDDMEIQTCINVFDFTMDGDFGFHPDRTEWAKEAHRRLDIIWEHKKVILDPTSLNEPFRQLWFAMNVADVHIVAKVHSTFRYQELILQRLSKYFTGFLVPPVLTARCNLQIKHRMAEVWVEWPPCAEGQVMHLTISREDHILYDEELTGTTVTLSSDVYPLVFEADQTLRIKFKHKKHDLESHAKVLEIHIPADILEQCANLPRVDLPDTGVDDLPDFDEDLPEVADVESEDDTEDTSYSSEDPDMEEPDTPATVPPVMMVAPPMMVPPLMVPPMMMPPMMVPPPSAVPISRPGSSGDHLRPMPQLPSATSARPTGRTFQARSRSPRRYRQDNLLDHPRSVAARRMQKSENFGSREDRSFYRRTYIAGNKGKHLMPLCLRHDRFNGRFCNDPLCNLDHVDTETAMGEASFGSVMRSLPPHVAAKYST